MNKPHIPFSTGKIETYRATLLVRDQPIGEGILTSDPKFSIHRVPQFVATGEIPTLEPIPFNKVCEPADFDFHCGTTEWRIVIFNTYVFGVHQDDRFNFKCIEIKS